MGRAAPRCCRPRVPICARRLKWGGGPTAFIGLAPRSVSLALLHLGKRFILVAVVKLGNCLGWEEPQAVHSANGLDHARSSGGDLCRGIQPAERLLRGKDAVRHRRDACSVISERPYFEFTLPFALMYIRTERKMGSGHAVAPGEQRKTRNTRAGLEVEIRSGLRAIICVRVLFDTRSDIRHAEPSLHNVA